MELSDILSSYQNYVPWIKENTLEIMKLQEFSMERNSLRKEISGSSRRGAVVNESD